MAEQIVEPRQAVEYPIDIDVSGQVDAIVRTAAWIGALSGDETLCSFTSLLLALLRVDGYSSSFVGSMSADIAEMRAHRRIDESGVEKAYRQAQDGGLPDGKPMFTTSARDMLRASAEVAREGGAEVVTARHLLLAYIFHTPPGHLDQMRAWKFDPATAQQEIRRNPRQSEAPQSAGSTEPQRIPGSVLAAYSFSDGALLVLRTAIAIALNRGAPRDFVGSSTLLAAMIAQVRASATDEGVGLAVLNGLFLASMLSGGEGVAVIEDPEQFQTSEMLPELSLNIDAILRLANQIARTTRSDGEATIAVPASVPKSA